MSQSEQGYIAQTLELLRQETARLQGRQARVSGASSVENPFLDRRAFEIGMSESDWFFSCDSWWRGWDEEDKLRLSNPLRLSAANDEGSNRGPEKAKLFGDLRRRG